jgi:carbon monoxide dehydrogenase subunit G
MAMKFAGAFEVKKKPEDVHDFLTDPNRFASLLPDFDSLRVLNPTHFTVTLNVTVSYIKGQADVEMELLNADRPRRAQYKGQGSFAGESMSMTAGFDLAPTAYGTKVEWQGEFKIVGRLASIAGTLLEPLSKKQVEKWIDRLKTELA